MTPKKKPARRSAKPRPKERKPTRIVIRDCYISPDTKLVVLGWKTPRQREPAGR